MKLGWHAVIVCLAVCGCKKGGSSSGAGGTGGGSVGTAGMGGASSGADGAARGGSGGAGGAVGAAGTGATGAAGASAAGGNGAGGASGIGGAGTAGGSGTGGGARGGASGSGAGTAGSCAVARPEPRFTVRRVAGLQPTDPTSTAQPTEDTRHSSIVIGRDGVPTFVYVARAQVLALPLTNVAPADAGVSGEIAKVLSNPAYNRIDGISRAAVKSDGTVAVAYLANNYAHYADWSGKMDDAPTASRLSTGINVNGCIPSKMGLAIDRQDRANILFCGSNGADIAYYAIVENGTWSVETIGSTYLPYSALAVDSSGNVVVGLANQFGTALQMVVGTRRGGVWQFTPTDPTSITWTDTWNFDPVVRVDSRDRFNIFFAAIPENAMRYGDPLGWWTSEGTGWTKTAVELTGAVLYTAIEGYHLDVAITNSGEIYVARYANGLVYDHFDGCRWTTGQEVYTFMDAGAAIWWPSVAVDATGRPHFSFQEMHRTDHNQDVLWSAEPLP